MTVPADQVSILKVKSASGELVRVSALKFESGDDLDLNPVPMKLYGGQQLVYGPSKKFFPDEGGMGTLWIAADIEALEASPLKMRSASPLDSAQSVSSNSRKKVKMRDVISLIQKYKVSLTAAEEQKP